MNHQQIFDSVKIHLLTQKVPSTDGGQGCMYRSGDLMCAIGIFIPNDVYNDSMEFNPVKELVNLAEDWNLPLDVFNYQNRALLIALQHVHDDYKRQSWTDGLKQVAKDFNLASA